MDNQALYETDPVVAKYASRTPRTRFLNAAEIVFVTKFSIIDKDVLVIGSGAGRVPANLALLGNRVTTIEQSRKLLAVSRTDIGALIPGITFMEGDARDMDKVPDACFDLVFFPMNGLDLVPSIEDRDRALVAMSRKVRRGGMLAFSSHNIAAHRFTRTPDYAYARENVIGGGTLFKGDPRFVIRHTTALTGFTFGGFTVDARSKWQARLGRHLVSARFFFGYLLYVFYAP